MNRDVRWESRYFFSTHSHKLVVSRLESLAVQQVFADQVTATVYFLPVINQDSEEGVYVRIRFYLPSLEQLFICNGAGFLEIKKTGRDGLVVKDRYPMDISQAFISLLNGGDGLFEKLSGLHGLFVPMIGTRVQRSHWLTSRARLTLDHNIQVFGFVDRQLPVGELITTLSEDKLEVKSNSFSDIPESLKDVVLDGIENHAETCKYLERRLKECHQQWHSKMLCR